MTRSRQRYQHISILCHIGQNRVTYPCLHQSLAKEKWDLQNGFRPSGTASPSLSILLPDSWTKIRVPLSRNEGLLLGRQPAISSTVRKFLLLHSSYYLIPWITRKGKWTHHPKNFSLVIRSNTPHPHHHPPCIQISIKHWKCAYRGVSSSLCAPASPPETQKIVNRKNKMAISRPEKLSKWMNHS